MTRYHTQPHPTTYCPRSMSKQIGAVTVIQEMATINDTPSTSPGTTAGPPAFGDGRDGPSDVRRSSEDPPCRIDSQPGLVPCFRAVSGFGNPRHGLARLRRRLVDRDKTAARRKLGRESQGGLPVAASAPLATGPHLSSSSSSSSSSTTVCHHPLVFALAAPFSLLELRFAGGIQTRAKELPSSWPAVYQVHQ